MPIDQSEKMAETAMSIAEAMDIAEKNVQASEMQPLRPILRGARLWRASQDEV
ncbi:MULTISPECIES: hypothetical protein [Bradyrhizobium]|uniref:hypothetical protein n=1 Tax=Bradyrhizobium elkanii TaxID=29448 RepID=UPI0012BD6EEE|nr:hypothetical protein [Bradyrhizobium elkanii]